MNALCLVIDRLHCGYLGCYGNSWVHTPAFNRLAAESLVLDQALVDSPDLSDLYRAWWTGRHAWEPGGGPAVPSQLAAQGVQTALLSDERFEGLAGLADALDQRIEVPLPEEAATAVEPGATHLAGFFASAIDWLAAAREPFCLWLHTQGLAAPWDAPWDYRTRYAEEDEPPPPRGAQVPRQVLDAQYDPDAVLGLAQAYAGQVSLLDECLGGLLEFLEGSAAGRETLLVVLSARGFSLGEHRRIGAWDDALHEELVHVPWLVRHPKGVGAAARSQALVQPADLAPTLQEWFGLSAAAPAFGRSLGPLVRDEVPSLRDYVVLCGQSGERALRTPAWYLRLVGQPAPPGDDPAARRLLYAKPDDRWEVNDVASRAGDVADALELALREFEACAKAGKLNSMGRLDASLIAEMH